MNKIIWQIVIPVALLFTLPTAAKAQFETDKLYLGPHLGLGTFGSSISGGGHIEYGLTKPGEAGPGRIGLGSIIDYWRWTGNAGYNGYTWTYTWVPVNVFGAYHFELPDRKWDLFAGLGLGYLVIDGTLDGPDGSTQDIYVDQAFHSHVFWSGVAGVRYFFSPALAAQARLGWGVSVLSLGVDFTL